MGTKGRLERQAALFGDANREIGRVTLGIVGLGGNGSVVALGAGYAGFRHFKLFDPDRLDLSNCNRFFAGGTGQVGQFKVDLVKKGLRLIDPNIRCKTLRSDVRTPMAQVELGLCDCILACPDNDETRAFLQKFCTERRIPLVEVGSGAVVRNGRVRMLGCKVSFYRPGEACIGCICLEDKPMEQSHQSFVGTNLVAAGLALTTLVAAVTQRWETRNFVAYDAIGQEMLSMNVARRPACPFCGSERPRAAAD